MNESDTMTTTTTLSSNNQQQQQQPTINTITYHQAQTMVQPQQQQQQQQASNAIQSSTSPLSNSSTNSSSCMTTSSASTSFSSPSLYSTLNQAQYQQLNNQIALSIPIQNHLQYQQQQQQQQSTNLVTITNNNSSNTSSTPTGNNSSNAISNINNSQTNNAYLDAAAFANSYSFVPQNASSFASSSNTTRPEAKKVKTHKTQPSKVAHIRNIPPQLTEVEVIQFGLIFGNIINVLNLRSKCQVKYPSLFFSSK
jgi:hypothetical protein